MKKNRRSFIAAALGAAVCSVSAALAGPVTVGSGSVEMSFNAASASGADRSQSFPVSLPGTASVEFDGGPGGPLDATGRSTAAYSLVDSGGGATLDVNLASFIPGEPSTSSSDVRFSLSFTTDRPLHYRLNASTNSAPTKTELRLDDFGATAETDQFGTFTGDWPAVRGPGDSIREFTDLLQEGDLPAGSHTLLLAINTFMLRDGNDNSNDASLRLALTGGEPTPTPVPLPAAAWPGLAGLGGVAALAAARKRRGAPVA